MARIGRILAWTAAIVIGVPIVLVALVLVAGNTGPGRRLIERLTPSLTGGEIHLAGLRGRFPDRLRATRLQIDDARGPYLTIDGLTLDWSPLQLLHGVLAVDRLDAASADFARLPLPGKSTSKSSGLPVAVAVRQFEVGRFTIAPAIAGRIAVLTLNGAGRLDTMESGNGHLRVRQVGGEGQYSVAGSVTARHLRATIAAREPAHGLISGLAGLPDLGPVAITATLNGPRNAVATALSASAGPLRASATGTLDLVHEAATLSVAASAPAMAPGPDLNWQGVSVNARINGSFTRPVLAGQVQIEALHAEGAGIARLTAHLSGDEGTAHLQATLDDLTLPGQDPTLFAGAPVQVDGTAQLAEPGRPVTFTVQHPLVQAQGTLRTAGALAAHVALTLPDLAPVSAAGGQTVQGHSALTLDVTRQAATTDIALRGTLGITGGQQQAQALLGNAAHLDLAASLTGGDATLTRLHVTGRSVDVSAHGSLVNARADLDWSLAIGDLAALDPTLTGTLDAAGEVSGPEQDLTATADLHGHIGANGVQSGPVTVHLAAQGLPNHPSGTVTAEGALLNAPIHLALAVSREAAGIHVALRQVTWKSLTGGGSLTLPPGAVVPLGTLHLGIARLADFAPLLGRQLAGSLDATLDATAATAKLTLTGQGLAMPGTASVSRIALDATVAHPQHDPAVQASLTVSGATAGTVSGATARLQARGTQQALALTLAATAPGVAGSPAQVNAAATVDVPARAVTLASLHAAWKQQTLRLLAPARFSLAHGATIDHLQLGLRQAVLAVNGRVSPTLDLTASLRDLPADIAAVAVPAAQANGTIAAQARLTGSLAQPDGTIRLTATGLRARTGPGTALPPANLVADATLRGTAAQLDVRLTAGTSHLAVTGTAPLAMTGPLALRAGGSLDLGLLNPILTATGQRVQGQLGLDAAIAGTAAAPRITGTARLTGGAAWDYTEGVHITDIAALVQADGNTVRLTRLSARAGTGSIDASGTVGLTAPLPVNLTLQTDNARLLASPLITAIIDTHLTVQGAVDGALRVVGTVHPRSVNVQIPSKLPASVAVLPVRVAGAPVPKPTPQRRAGPPAAAAPERSIALNITLNAPNQVFIRGRGLNAELGGVVHIHGTAAQPLPSGGLNLLRGTMSLVGQTLTFSSGSIDFVGQGISDPAINLVATSSTATMTATLTVGGTAQNPKITLSSSPTLPQDQILAQLLFHQGEGSLGPFQVAEIAAGLAQLSGTSSGLNPLDSLRNALGLDQLTVGSNASGNPTLQAGRYVAPGVYLGAQQAATGNGTQATLQIDLAKGLKLETSAGTATATATGAASSGQAASVGLTYQFQY